MSPRRPSPEAPSSLRRTTARPSRAFFGAAERSCSTPQKIETADARCDEHRSEQEAGYAAAGDRRHEEQRHSDPDERDAEDRRAYAMEPVHAATRAATTIT